MRTIEEVYNEVYLRLENGEEVCSTLNSELNQHGVQVSTVKSLVDSMKDKEEEEDEDDQ